MICKSESEKCAILDLRFKADMCRFVLHELVQSFAFRISNTYKAFVSGPINEGGLGGVRTGNFTAWIFACSVGTCLQYYPTITCSTTCRAVPWKSKVEHKKDLTWGWQFLWMVTLHCDNPHLSLFLSISVCVSFCPVFVSHVVITAQKGESVCSCRTLWPVGAPANTQRNTVKIAN